MALDKLVDSTRLDGALTATANAIIAKTGGSSPLTWDMDEGFSDDIDNIPTGTDVSDTTATASDVRTGKYFYTSAGTKTQGTIQDQAAQTITPGTTDQTIASGKYLTGTQTIKGDADLVAGNIKKDVQIFGVTGTYEGSGGGAEAEWNDVIFYDYDGKRLYSYSASDFANLSAMPANPTHEGLTAQGWNWSLSDAKAFVATYGALDIGQMYTTSDGKTRLYFNIASENVLKIRISWGQTVSYGVTVDFGDGTATVTKSGTGGKDADHTYSSTGTYIVTLTATSGTMTVKPPYYSTNYGNIGASYLQAVEAGNNVTGFDGSFYNYVNDLKYITLPNTITSLPGSLLSDAWAINHLTIPNSVTTIGSSVFNNTYSIRSVSFPKQVTIDTYLFSYCYVLSRETIDYTNATTGVISQYCYTAKKIIIPSCVTTISAGAYQYCKSVDTFIIPSTVTTIGVNAFGNCNGAKEFHFKSTTPPTLGGTNAFSGTLSTSVFYVPSASLDAYKTANNWSSYASRMVGE